MNNRRKLIVALGAGALTASFAARAQQQGKIPVIGIVVSSPTQVAYRIVKEGLRDAGYLEGKTITIESRFWEGQSERLPELMEELVRLNPAVIVIATAPAVSAAMRVTTSVPIVFMGVGGDPVALGLVRTLARPGGNVTGFTHMANELGGRQVQLLKEAVPEISRLAVLINPSNPNKDYFGSIEVAARKLGVKAYRVEAQEAKDFEPAFAPITRNSRSALLVQPDAFFSIPTQGARIVALATERRVPTISSSRGDVEAGGLMSYGSDLVEHYSGVATYVDKILKGAKVGDLPVQRPTKFELVINMKTAKALGIKFSNSILVQASRVIE